MIILDTNVVSEPMRPQANAAVLDWLGKFRVQKYHSRRHQPSGWRQQALSDSRPFLVAVMLLAGLASGCGPGSGNPDRDAEAGGPLNTLPLKRGFYVAMDTPCSQASNATLRLVTAEGINSARTVCTFTRIEPSGPDTYRVTEACGDIQSDEPPGHRITTYVLQGDTGFTFSTTDGWEGSARYCAQSSLPEPWRENDISGLTEAEGRAALLAFDPGCCVTMTATP